MLLSLKTSQDYSIKNIKELKNYTWEKTATKTIDFIENTLKSYKNG